MEKKPSRQRVQPLKVWALPAEATVIKANAAGTIDRILLERFADAFILNAGDEFRQTM